MEYSVCGAQEDFQTEHLRWHFCPHYTIDSAYGQYSALEEMITPSLLDDIGFCLHYDDHSLCIMVDVSTTAGGGFP